MKKKYEKKLTKKIDINPFNLYYNYDDNELYDAMKQAIKDDKYNFQSLIHIEEGNISPKKFIIPNLKPKTYIFPEQIFKNNYQDFNLDMTPFYESNIKPLTYYDIYPEEKEANSNKLKCTEYNYLPRPDYTKYTTKYDQELFDRNNNDNNNNYFFTHDKLSPEEEFRMNDLKIKKLNEKKDIYAKAFKSNPFQKTQYKKCSFVED
jgi:hypothetical protein